MRDKIKDETGVYDEQTLFRFYAAAGRTGLEYNQIQDLVNEVLNEGLLIRERP